MVLGLKTSVPAKAKGIVVVVLTIRSCDGRIGRAEVAETSREGGRGCCCGVGGREAGSVEGSQ